MEYKTQCNFASSLNRSKKYSKIFKNREIDNSGSSKSTKDPSQFNNPYDDIHFIMNISLNQSENILQVIESLTKTIKSGIAEVASIIVETKFIPFLTHKIAEYYKDIMDVKAKLVRLILAILDNYKSLHIIFFNEGLLPILSDFIKDSNETDIRILVYSIFSINDLCHSFHHTNSSDFEDCISITDLYNSYQRILQIQCNNKMKLQFLKGLIVFTSKVCCIHQLNDKDSESAFNLVYSTLIQPKEDIYEFALQALPCLIESGKMDFDYFDSCKMPEIIQSRFNSDIFKNQILSCDIFVALFKKGYFQNHCFDIHVNTILTHIDECLRSQKNCASFIRLITALIKNDDDNSYIPQFYLEKNNYQILTICKCLCKGNFDMMESASYCIIEIFFKAEGAFYDKVLNNGSEISYEIIQSIIKIIYIGKDLDDVDIIESALKILDHIFSYSQLCNKFDDAKEIFRSLNGTELLLEFDQNDYDSECISSLSDKMQSMFD